MMMTVNGWEDAPEAEREALDAAWEMVDSKQYRQNVRQFMGQIERDRGPSLSERAMRQQDAKAQDAVALYRATRATRTISTRGKVRRVA